MPWENAPTEFVRRNLFIEINGEEKTGKSTLAMSAKPDISIVDMNDGLDGVIQKALRKYNLKPPQIQRAYHPLPQYQEDKDKLRVIARKQWDLMFADVQATLAAKRATLFFDSGTELYALARYSEMGGLKSATKKGQLDYEGVNSKMRGLYHMFHAHKTNFIVTHQVRDEWKDVMVDGEKKRRTTGKKIANGWDDTAYTSQVILNTKKVIDNDGLHFVATLQTCRFAPELEGTEFQDDQFYLPFIMGFVTDTDTSEWEA